MNLIKYVLIALCVATGQRRSGSRFVRHSHLLPASSSADLTRTHSLLDDCREAKGNLIVHFGIAIAHEREMMQ